MTTYKIPAELENGKPGENVCVDSNKIRGFSQVDTIAERDAITTDLRKLNHQCNVNGTIYIYTGEDLTDVNWTDSNKWKLYSAGGGAFIDVLNVNSNVSQALPFYYYRVDATSAPVTVFVPVPQDNNKDEYDIELRKNTHKVTIAVVGNIPGKIDGYDSIVIPNEGGRVRLRNVSSAIGYEVVADNRNMGKTVVITEDRDFTTDGIEHEYTYQVKPAIAGQAILLTLPAPKSYEDSHSIFARFILSSAGSVTIIREDGGYIGDKTSHLIATVGKSITIEESNSEYNIIQDSRPSLITNISFPFYRLTEDHDLIPGYKAMALSTDDVRYGNESLLLTPPISSTTATVYASYATDTGINWGTLQKGSIDFFVTTRKQNVVGSNVFAYYEIFKRTSAGVETLIVTSPNFIISSNSFSQFRVSVSFPETTFADGDYIVMKVLVGRTATGGTDPILETKIEGTDGAYFQRTIASTIARHNDFGGRNDIDAHPISAITGLQTELDSKLDSISGNDGEDVLSDGAGGTKTSVNSIFDTGTNTRQTIGKTLSRATSATRQTLLAGETSGVIEVFSVDSEGIIRIKEGGLVPVGELGYMSLYYDTVENVLWMVTNSGSFALNRDTLERLNNTAENPIHGDSLMFNADTLIHEFTASAEDREKLAPVTPSITANGAIDDDQPAGYYIDGFRVYNNGTATASGIVFEYTTAGGEIFDPVTPRNVLAGSYIDIFAHEISSVIDNDNDTNVLVNLADWTNVNLMIIPIYKKRL